MKKTAVICLVIAVLLVMAGCGAQEPLETWPIAYNDMTIVCYNRSYPDIASMLAEDHIIFHGKAVGLVKEAQMGIQLELEAIECSEPDMTTILLRQGKDPDIVLKKGEEVVLILHNGGDDGVWEIPNSNLGAFRIDQETGAVYCPRLESLLESAPEKYAGKKLTLDKVYDLLVELDKAD